MTDINYNSLEFLLDILYDKVKEPLGCAQEPPSGEASVERLGPSFLFFTPLIKFVHRLG